ncbi:MAG: hypothetical protein JWO90_2461, partial [Solirubrobacterales bacterium]|nr:hypothetical protein [Solirubrobacterales bacterium]
MRPGRGMLLTSDGLGEARSAGSAQRAAGARLGEATIVGLLRDLRGVPPRWVVDRLTAATVAHGGGLLADDSRLLAVRA